MANVCICEHCNREQCPKDAELQQVKRELEQVKGISAVNDRALDMACVALSKLQDKQDKLLKLSLLIDAVNELRKEKQEAKGE